MWRNRYFWLRIGRDFLREDTVGAWLIVRPRTDLTFVGCMVAGRHFEVMLRLPRLTVWGANVGPSLPPGH